MHKSEEQTLGITLRRLTTQVSVDAEESPKDL